ncbi:MAG: branched-chain amino acid ABC transporter permease [Spirochaetaceae bacterium]|jgi:branched-chain amino acid transport system permease protein|nr:branched-chain amino acid ABC transporter permease [Spirochaetaceae bacterium]
MSDYAQGILILVCINLIAVLGICVLTGWTRLLSFGNAGFMSIGAYASALLTTKLGIPFIPAAFAGALAAAAVSFLLGSLTLKLKGDYFLITTLGFGESIRVLFEYIRPVTGGAQGLSGIPRYTTTLVACISALAALVLTVNFLYSRFGRSLEAVREEELAAAAAGINVPRYKKTAFVISAVFAGWAGALYAHNMMFLVPVMFNLPKSAELTITVVIGGMASVTGSVLGALVVTLLPEFLRDLSNYRMFFYGTAVVLIIMLRPSGLLGYTEFSPRKAARYLSDFIARKKAETARRQ